MEDFITSYLAYASRSSEVPMIFHRWACISGLGAFLGRQYNLAHGHSIIQPNMYCMLIGTAGTRKSTAIKTMKKLLTKAGYNTYAAEKTTKEKFLIDLSKAGSLSGGVSNNLNDLLDSNLFGDYLEDHDLPNAEMYVTADEFNDFFGNNILDFLSMLGVLWDKDGVYENSIKAGTKNGESIVINNPTINIIGGNTPTTFANTFPPEIFGQGFFSRCLIIHGESNGKRIAFPDAPGIGETEELITQLRIIRETSIGTIELSGSAKAWLETIYNQYVGFSDIRFESFSTRRFTHLLKLCLIISASRSGKTIEKDDVIVANTILSHAELFMPKALGEFGKGKHSDITHKVLQIIKGANEAIYMNDLWKTLSQELDDISQLQNILISLLQAEKIQRVTQDGALLPVRKPIIYENNDVLDWSILSEEERSMTR